MKVKDLIEELQKADPELECFGVHGASGVTYEVDGIGEDMILEDEPWEAGVLADKAPGFRFFSFCID